MIAALAAHADDAQSSMITDAFKLQKYGKVISASLRIHVDAQVDCLRVSGHTWLFAQPLGMSGGDFPVIWDTTQMPYDLTAYRERCLDIDALGLAIDERRLGFRVHATEESYIRQVLSKPKLVTWRLAGLPLTCSFFDAAHMLQDDFQFDGEVLESSRQVWRGRQSWLVKSTETDPPSEDTVRLVVDAEDEQDTTEHFITLRPVDMRPP
eukprot:3719259-Amphidinium_carterae.1